MRANVFTRFNALITLLAAVVLTVGHPIDAIFAMVMIVNALIGIVQEVRAKRTLDRMRILVTPSVLVLRDGRSVDVGVDDLVVDDVIELRTGDQVPVDGIVLDTTGFEVDESALTGESDPIGKLVGDAVRSGSAVVGGGAAVRASAVGSGTWIHQLTAEAKEFALAESEIRRGVDQILRVVGWIIVPLGSLLVWSQLRADDRLGPALVSSVAGVIGLVPQGLVLLVSMALAVGVLRLSRNHVLVQELHAVEGLARVDVLCLDKTGTLTTGAMELDRLVILDGESGEEIEVAIAELAAAEPTPSRTLLAAAAGRAPTGWSVTSQTVFSSARKWSAATFEPGGTWVIGAPEVLLGDLADSPLVDEARSRLAELAADARRILMIGRSSEVLCGELLPPDLKPVAFVVLTEEIRADAAETMAYFAKQHVEIKIVSGDNPATVSQVAEAVGVPGAEQFVDLREVDLDDGGTADLVASTTVFGRVLPHQKRRLVEVLQGAGHTVAMTGDGVNDIPALKRADIGIAMDTATPATRAISQLVLLDGRFDRLPAVVAEGRRVITNMERVSALFVTKTVYAAIFALTIGIWGAAFPFLPRHMSLVSEVTIGIPAFALSFRSTDRPYRPGYIGRVLRFALPAGIATACITLVAYWMLRLDLLDVRLDEARTGSTIVLVILALWVLTLLMKPIDRFDGVVLTAMVALTVVATATPLGRTFYELHWPDWQVLVILGVYVGGVITGASVVVRRIAVSDLIDRAGDRFRRINARTSSTRRSR